MGRRCDMSSAAARLSSRDLLVADVVGDGQKLEGGERAEDDVDFVALDQFLRLGLGAGRGAAGVGGDEFDLAAGHRVIGLLQIGEHALLHLDAALGERTGLDREKTELERRGLRDRRAPESRRTGRGGACRSCRPAACGA